MRKSISLPFFLVVTSAVGIAGAIAKAGSLVLASEEDHAKGVRVVEVDGQDVPVISEAEGLNFLHRGKARPATAKDGAPEDMLMGADLRQDGPTIAEYVGAGYSPKLYPPEGYASRSTADEIAAAIAAEDADDKAGEGGQADKAKAK